MKHEKDSLQISKAWQLKKKRNGREKTKLNTKET